MRGLRRGRGWTLDELSARCFISASTLNRIETARQRVSLDQLAAIARALGTTLDTLVDSSGVDDVVIRPQHPHRGLTVWQLNAGPGRPENTVVRLRLTLPAPVGDPHALRVHDGDEWRMVLSGTLELLLDDRTHIVKTGNATSSSTMVPHAMGAFDGPAEVLLVQGREGDRVHQNLR